MFSGPLLRDKWLSAGLRHAWVVICRHAAAAHDLRDGQAVPYGQSRRRDSCRILREFIFPLPCLNVGSFSWQCQGFQFIIGKF